MEQVSQNVHGHRVADHLPASTLRDVLWKVDVVWYALSSHGFPKCRDEPVLGRIDAVAATHQAIRNSGRRAQQRHKPGNHEHGMFVLPCASVELLLESWADALSRRIPL